MPISAPSRRISPFPISSFLNSVASRVAHGRRAGDVERRIEHMAQLVFIFRSHDHHTGQGGEIDQIIEPVVSGTIGAHDAAPIKREGDGSTHEAGIVHHLVEGALQERGINRRDRPHALAGQTHGEGHGVLLRNAHIEKAVRKALGEFIQAGAFAHGGRDGDNAGVFFRQFAHGLAKNGGVRRSGSRSLVESAGRDIELRYAVIFHWQLLSDMVALALLGNDVDQRGLGIILHSGQHGQKLMEVVAVDGADVFKPEFFEHQTGNQHRLRGLHNVL